MGRLGSYVFSVPQQERVGGRGDRALDTVSLLMKMIVVDRHSFVSALSLNSLFPSFLPVVTFGIRASAFEFQGGTV